MTKLTTLLHLLKYKNVYHMYRPSENTHLYLTIVPLLYYSLLSYTMIYMTAINTLEYMEMNSVLIFVFLQTPMSNRQGCLLVNGFLSVVHGWCFLLSG